MSKAQETILEIHLNALTHNYNYLKNKLESKTKFLAVIKAFAYGSDCVEVAKHLETLNVDYFAVAYTNEGVLLRDAGVTTPILVLHPQAVNFKTIIERCLEPSIYSPKILKEFISVAEQENQKDYPVHLKFNTGLNRLGFWQNDIDIIASNLKKTKAIIAKSLFSHLAASEDENEEEFSLQQIKDFKAIATDFTSKMGYRPWLHLCNTSGVINYPEAHLDMVRCGIGLYGFGNSEKEDGNLKPIAKLKSIISQIHKIEKDETVGYNRAYTAFGFEKTATIPIGHADGISRQFGNEKGFVFINNQKVPIIGNVCMDMIMINITGIDCQEGDEVIIFDENHKASSFAESTNTISYEVLTSVSQRVKRVFYR
ncbi:alanine racemase [Winogradskyella sp. PC-19]|uniref:alanine racemase n=1 Tax=unclassified Winogradskyella TaxID=2615021 RepID=UPI000B3CB94A|nr:MULTISPECIES: alanine racemase [unclassified Winogradskyella]ARV09780.1 alanine racemase [Winogradskyella sp. PC-19]RZN74719.1 MAG: alanine racemase [Winogradskyella sp.]